MAQTQQFCEEDTFDPPTFPPERSEHARSNQFTFNFGTGCAWMKRSVVDSAPQVIWQVSKE
jgi:hypothetical protein